MMSPPPIRVLVVDDTVTYRKIVAGVLAEVPNVEVIGSAPNGKIALYKIEHLRPDLITLDLEMPEMDGIEVLQHLKERNDPVGVIVLSASSDHAASATMTALNLGAFDFVLKPTGNSLAETVEEIRSKLESKINAFVRARDKRSARDTSFDPGGARADAQRADRRKESTGLADHFSEQVTRKPEVIALGISTGGPAALLELLPTLPADLASPLLIVQHMPPLFTKSMAEDLDRRTELSVAEATDGQFFSPGQVLLAPGGRQMGVERTAGGTIVRVTDDPPENSCRPSVDYLFRSVPP